MSTTILLKAGKSFSQIYKKEVLQFWAVFCIFRQEIMYMKHFSFLFIFHLIFSCKAPKTITQVPGSNKYTDQVIRDIYTAQDERKTQALIPYLTHINALYRQEAALAFASVQDSAASTPLIQLLSDPETKVRQSAAYALGQMGKKSAENTLIEAIEKETDALVKKELLEALGKCATQKGLDALTTWNYDDPTLQAGQAWGIYRTNNQQLNYNLAVLKQVGLLTSPSPEARLAAAHFLARTARLDLTSHFENILNAAQIDPSPDVRMAAAQALGKVKSAELPDALAGIIQTDPDYRVRLNAIRATTNLELSVVKQLLWRALTDKNIYTALTAAEIIAAKATPAEADALLLKAEQTLRWRVRATLLGAALKIHPKKKEVLTKIQERYITTNNVYEKAALLTAAGKDMAGASFVEQETFSTQTPVIRTSGMESITELRSSKNFPVSQKGRFADIFKRAFATGDVGMIAITATLLRNPELNFKADLTDISFLETALAKLVLPRDMETYQEVKKTLDYLEGKPQTPTPQNPFTHPINWALVQNIPANQQVEVRTSRGTITFELFVEDAPGTVGNFVELARGGFFNGKNFHRVVPNFVVQGGDPRGDGWGGTDYAIRSEFGNLRYREGYIGMASAGKDTESCQWFITHSPTPHLDGRYTIFAKVITGMEVLHLLEISDIIDQVIVK